MAHLMVIVIALLVLLTSSTASAGDNLTLGGALSGAGQGLGRALEQQQQYGMQLDLMRQRAEREQVEHDALMAESRRLKEESQRIDEQRNAILHESDPRKSEQLIPAFNRRVAEYNTHFDGWQRRMTLHIQKLSVPY